MRKFAKLTLAITLSVSASLPTTPAFAASPRDAQDFHELLRSVVPSDLAREKMPYVHMIPDDNILKAADADSLQSAMEAAKQTSLIKLIENTKTAPNSMTGLDADRILSKKPVTIVIVPGFLGEFIENRGFEEVFAPIDLDKAQKAAEAGVVKESATQVRDESTADFLDKVSIAYNGTDKTPPNGSSVDSLYLVNKLDDRKVVKLSDVIHVGALKGKNGKNLAKVVLFYTKRMSLESIGDLEDNARTFSRRLSKYLALTGPQDLIFVGYSRGTPLALEMLAQAQKENQKKAADGAKLPFYGWLPSVKAMISLGGVSWGSSLADVYDREGDAKNALSEVEATANSLWSAHILAAPTTIYNSLRWAKTLAVLGLFTDGKAQHAVTPSPEFKSELLDQSIDLGAIRSLAHSLSVELGLLNPVKWVTEYAANISRFRKFSLALVAGIRGLTSSARLEWWKTHELPKSVHYYTISAAMANPGSQDAEEKTIFKDMGIGYAMNADDKSLLQNSLDYKHESGVALNDSQVAIPQAMFLPNFIAKLNPANAGLKTSFLGTCGTHHWGLALRKVSVKSEHGNPFPREALLKALAAKVVLDQARNK